MKLFIPEAEPAKAPTQPAAIEGNKAWDRFSNWCKLPEWTIVARGPKAKGHRFMIRAATFEKAHRAGVRLCRRKRLDFVAVFAGHMSALQRE